MVTRKHRMYIVHLFSLNVREMYILILVPEWDPADGYVLQKMKNSSLWK
jgi:hypothetical protein